MDWLAFVKVNASLRGNGQVIIPRRHEGDARHEEISLLRFAYRDLALPIEALGEGARERMRHVLNDDHRRGEAPGEVRDDGAKSARSAGRGADDDQLARRRGRPGRIAGPVGDYTRGSRILLPPVGPPRRPALVRATAGLHRAASGSADGCDQLAPQPGLLPAHA